jgi:large subunit ribosomal protein L32
MAVPKRRKSKATRDSRRAQWMRSCPKPAVGLCPRCQEPKQPHRVCGHCGYYHDRKILDVEELVTKA